MYKIKCDRLYSYFEENIGKCVRMQQELSANQRNDEAVFARVQMNVFDIFKTVFAVANKKFGCEKEIVDFFLSKLDTMPSGWQESMQKAENTGDIKTAHIEKIKIETAENIRAKFCEIWEIK